MITVHILARTKLSFKWPLLLSTITMFSASTGSIIVAIYIVFAYLVPGKTAPVDLAHPKYIFYVVNRYALQSSIKARG
jgi:hypothetical protein